jgi:hypothetical protein
VRLVRLVSLPAVLVICALAAPAAGDPPLVTIDIAGTAGTNGWYRSPVTLTWTVSAAASPVGSTSCSVGVTQIVLVADAKGSTFACKVSDGVTEQEAKVTIRIDKTPPPTPVPVPARPPDAGNWYDRPVTIAWTGSDPMSGIAACTSLAYAGPDDATATPGGTCRDVAGNTSAPAPFALSYDATAPQITAATPDRPPDRGGWYVQPVSYAVQATDATSGLAGCAPMRYAAPDDSRATATTTCTDRAGNSATTSAALRYDGTAPAFRRLTVAAAPGTATLRWATSPDTEVVTVSRGGSRAHTFRGPTGSFADTGLLDGARYAYTVIAADAAGNTTTRKLRAKPPSMLLAPAPGKRLSRPPVLRWRRARGADYYNVQLYRGGRKVLSTWPVGPHLGLRRSWQYGGALRRLSPGAYRWYVWPGYGPLSQRRYGHVLGSRGFVVVQR